MRNDLQEDSSGSRSRWRSAWDRHRCLAQGQWGSGPIKVAIVTKGHNFDRDGFFNFWDSLGQDITWTHLQHPAALEFFDPAIADTFDVYAFYDAPGRTATPGA